MLGVSKCCCFFNLRYGFFTFAIISLLYRICAATSLYSGILIQTSKSPKDSPRVVVDFILLGFGALVGWYSATAILLSVALKGVMQKKSALLYPYTVVLIVEILPAVVLFLYIIWTAPIAEALWPLIHLIVIGTVNSYAALCLISLSHDFKHSDGRFLPATRKREFIFA